MSGFKCMVENDIYHTFLDLDFFGELHLVEGSEIPIVIDDKALKERQGGQELAVAQSALLFYAKSCDVGKRSPGELLNVDGREYIVDDWQEDMGIYTISLSENIPA